MAELGAIGSIVGIAAAGAKLSMVLFDFASTVGSARYEVQQIGTEISQFCAVLKQLHSTLTKAKARRYSISAIGTTQDILKRCQIIFKEIEDIVKALRKSRAGGKERDVDLVARVKWTFKRSQVQVLQKTLESSKNSLQLMLLVLDLAQKTASPRVSTIATQLEDEQDQAVIQSLIAAHRCTVDQLESLEDETEEEDEGQSLALSSGMQSPDTEALQLPNRSKSRANRDFGAPEGGAKKRASVWVSDLIFDGTLPAGFRRNTWGDAVSACSLAPQAGHLFEKWTIKADNETKDSNEPQGRSFQNKAEGFKNEDPENLGAPPKSLAPLPSRTVPQGNIWVQALYNWDEDGETTLNFHAGDIIQVVRILESGWWDGVLNGFGGWFPRNYCRMLSGPESIQKLLAIEEQGEYEEAAIMRASMYSGRKKFDYANIKEKTTRSDYWTPQYGWDGDALLNDFWIPQATPDGKLYYYNTETQESVFEHPENAPNSPEERSSNADEINIGIAISSESQISATRKLQAQDKEKHTS